MNNELNHKLIILTLIKIMTLSQTTNSNCFSDDCITGLTNPTKVMYFITINQKDYLLNFSRLGPGCLNFKCHYNQHVAATIHIVPVIKTTTFSCHIINNIKVDIIYNFKIFIAAMAITIRSVTDFGVVFAMAMVQTA